MLYFSMYITVMAVLNRARGTKFWDYIESNTFSRILWALLVADCTIAHAYFASHVFSPTLLLLWPLLYGWSMPAWGKYFAAVHGNINPAGGKFILSEWALDKLQLPVATVFQRKMWGVVGMAVRNVLIVPAVVVGAIATGNYWALAVALVFPVMGVSYYIGGLVSQKAGVMIAELLNGAIIGAMLLGTGL